MATQYDQVMEKLDLIISLLYRIGNQDFGTADESGMEDELFGEDPYDPRDAEVEVEAEVLRPTLPGATRRFVEVRAREGGLNRVDRNELDPLVLRIVDESVKAGTFWMLYERESDGQIMVSAEENVINQVRRGEVAPTADAPDLSE